MLCLAENETLGRPPTWGKRLACPSFVASVRLAFDIGGWASETLALRTAWHISPHGQARCLPHVVAYMQARPSSKVRCFGQLIVVSFCGGEL